MNNRGYDLPTDPLPPEKCSHTFAPIKDIQKDYTDDLCEKVIKYGREGKLIEGFAGRFNVCPNSMCKWLSEPDKYPDFDSAVKISVSACIHYWLEELQHAIESGDWQYVGLVRNILSDIMKSMPKELREGLFDRLDRESAEDKSKRERNESMGAFVSSVTGAGA